MVRRRNGIVIKKSKERKAPYALYDGEQLVLKNIPIIKNQELVDKIKNNIDVIYKELKKGEIAPKDDYLMANIKTTTERSIEKLKILNNVKF